MTLVATFPISRNFLILQILLDFTEAMDMETGDITDQIMAEVGVDFPADEPVMVEVRPVFRPDPQPEQERPQALEELVEDKLI